MALLSGFFGDKGQDSREARFWKWFQSNGQELFNAPTAANPHFDGVKRELSKVRPGLTFEVSRIENGKRELVISADGNRDAFPAVKRLVAAAPSMSNWYVTAFRPRESRSLTSLRIEMGGITLDPEDIWFAARPPASGSGVELLFAIRGMTTQNIEKYMRAAIILMETALGEYDAVMKVRSVRAIKLPDDPSRLRPFTALPAFIDGVTVDENV